MPNALLISQALYSVPTLASELETLGYPGAPGYQRLKDKYSKPLAEEKAEVPSVSSIHSIFRGELIKYVLCDGVIRLLNVARTDKELPVLALSAIEAHEFWMPDLEGALRQAAAREGKKQNVVVKEIALKTGRHTGLITHLRRKHRTTEDRCADIRDAIQDLYGLSCRITDELPPLGPRSGKGRRRTLAVVPKKVRDPV
ncbi:hypothetical protein [Sphingomonas sp. KR3-1]|uniref:hypothetical protein n=1 Tax=Sphingomonas sp. KR3-1 TaxID=3156611 RepID=UPI0032B45AF8